MEMPLARLLRAVSCLIVVSFAGYRADARYGGGRGEPDDPYLIFTAEQMNDIGTEPNDWDKHFRLMVDIDLSALGPNQFNIIGYWGKEGDALYDTPFTGVFDGNGHVIANLHCRSMDRNCVGIFGYIHGPDAQVVNVTLRDPNVHAGTESYYTGSLVGLVRSCRVIANCRVEGGCISGGYEVGGLIGDNESRVEDCAADTTVFAKGPAGGLIGQNSGLVVSSCAGGRVSSDWAAGGLIGLLRCTAVNCYSQAQVSGNSDVGGLVGYCHGGIIVNSYSTGRTLASLQGGGGLVGSGPGRIIGCLWDKQTSGQGTSAGGIGKVTVEMKAAGTFAGWGYDSAWTIDDGGDYPRLLWENKPGTAITTPSPVTNLTGGGTESDPYLIHTAEELDMIGMFPCEWDKHFKLMADVDLKGFGDRFHLIGVAPKFGFAGVFDGNGHAITGFHYSCGDTDSVGLFACIDGPDALVKDLGVDDPNLHVAWAWGGGAGSLVGFLAQGTVEHCFVTGGVVSSDSAGGGLVGRNSGTVRGCYSDTTVTGSPSGGGPLGGLVGHNAGGTIIQCASGSDVSGYSHIGGLTGTDEGGIIRESSAAGDVSGSWYAGGLIGAEEHGIITACYSTCTVVGENYTGGLVAYNHGRIVDCYSAGPVLGGKGYCGLVQINQDGTIEDCFWDVETTGHSRSAGDVGRTSRQMRSASTFGAWGCGDPVWTIDATRDYPRLRWENKPGTVILKPSYGGGRGTEADPYLIYTAEHLNCIGPVTCDLDKHFKLMADLDLSGYKGTDFNIIGISPEVPFTGVFDGSGRIISNLEHGSSLVDCVGLFGCVGGSRATIRDLGLLDPDIDATMGQEVGGLVGHLSEGTITRCFVRGGCISGDQRVGGLVGSNSGTIELSYSAASAVNGDCAGGLTGSNFRGSMRRCYALGEVTGGYCAGGLAGESLEGIMQECYAASGSVRGVCAGGVVGNRYSARITASFWDKQTSGLNEACGWAEWPDKCDNEPGKTTAQMQMAGTFLSSGWDFAGETGNGSEDIWWILEGQSYPRLYWELTADNSPRDP
ncbi:MAG: hypothetical protein JW955_06780 [Sedimentisphaerales bacterium]|nr:hypothetical protein [Sedimentisphaerales bacterium]